MRLRLTRNEVTHEGRLLNEGNGGKSLDQGRRAPPRGLWANNARASRLLFALQVKVYLHNNAAHWLAIGGDVEEHSWIRHCNRQEWGRVTSGEGKKVVARAEKGGSQRIYFI